MELLIGFLPTAAFIAGLSVIAQFFSLIFIEDEPWLEYSRLL